MAEFVRASGQRSSDEMQLGLRHASSALMASVLRGGFLIRQGEGAFKETGDGGFLPGFGFQAYEQGNFYHGDFSFLKLNYERQTLMVISIPHKWQD